MTLIDLKELEASLKEMKSEALGRLKRLPEKQRLQLGAQIIALTKELERNGITMVLAPK